MTYQEVVYAQKRLQEATGKEWALLFDSQEDKPVEWQLSHKRTTGDTTPVVLRTVAEVKAWLADPFL